MKIVNIDRNNRSGEKFTILGIVGWFGQFYDSRPPLSRYRYCQYHTCYRSIV